MITKCWQILMTDYHGSDSVPEILLTIEYFCDVACSISSFSTQVQATLRKQRLGIKIPLLLRTYIRPASVFLHPFQKTMFSCSPQTAQSPLRRFSGRSLSCAGVHYANIVRVCGEAAWNFPSRGSRSRQPHACSEAMRLKSPCPLKDVSCSVPCSMNSASIVYNGMSSTI